ncbi:MAG: putative nucleotidyltransferase substrate binding domain-containing protein, partial [Candidatus Berkiella sp.]
TLGSMAREESCPVTDLEIGLLLKEKSVENYKYFYQLSQNISDRLFLLGEHPDVGGKGLRMDEADNAPPHRRFFARNMTKEQAQQLQQEAIMNRDWKKIPYEGSRPFLTTYDEFAEFSQPEFTQDRKVQQKIAKEAFQREWLKASQDPKNKKMLSTEEGTKKLKNEIGYWVNQMHKPYNNRELAIANSAGKKLGRNMALLYGNEQNYQQFIDKKNAIFAKEEKGVKGREKVALEKMREDITDILTKGKSLYLTGKLDKTLDIKRELYRFTEQFVTNLGFYHHCQSQNSLDIINELVARNTLSPEFAQELTDFIQFTTGLRLKEQAILKRQGYATYIDEAEFNEDKEKLEKEISLLTDAISYMQSTPDCNSDAISQKQRALVELKSKYEHLLEMAPGRIINPEDLALLKDKYIPIAQEIFKQAQLWTQGTPKLGFKCGLSEENQKVVEESVDYLKQHPGGFFPALSLLREKAKSKPVENAFIAKCKDNDLLTLKDKVMLTAQKMW